MTRSGNLALALENRPPLKYIDRFWLRVDKTPGQGPQGTCWLWIGSIAEADGYGRFTYRLEYGFEGTVKLTRTAHRVSYLIEHGFLPALDICHTCDNPPCVNPAHLWAGTKKQNMEDKNNKGRNTFKNRLHCSRGHEYPSNVKLDKRGVIICYQCSRDNKRRNRLRKKGIICEKL